MEMREDGSYVVNERGSWMSQVNLRVSQSTDRYTGCTHGGMHSALDKREILSLLTTEINVKDIILVKQRKSRK